MKKSILTSVVASAVLASVLAMSGCGGSNSSDGADDALPTLSAGDTKAEGRKEIIADANGNVNIAIDLVSKKAKAKVAKATVRQVKNKDGSIACGADNPCTVIAKQISACKIDAKSDSFNNALDHVDSLIKGSGDRYDANTDMIVFGGTMQIDGSGFEQAALDLEINMIGCGSAISRDNKPIEAGFSNKGHSVDVFVQAAAGPISESSEQGFWIRDVKIKDGKIQLTSEMIEKEFKKVGGKGACLNIPVTFTFYSIKPAKHGDGTPVEGVTGISGASS